MRHSTSAILVCSAESRLVIDRASNPESSAYASNVNGRGETFISIHRSCCFLAAFVSRSCLFCSWSHPFLMESIVAGYLRALQVGLSILQQTADGNNTSLDQLGHPCLTGSTRALAPCGVYPQSRLPAAMSVRSHNSKRKKKHFNFRQKSRGASERILELR